MFRLVFQGLPCLTRLFLEDNLFARVDHLGAVLKCKALKEITLAGNPCTNDRVVASPPASTAVPYRLHLVYALPQLLFIDMKGVTDVEKRRAFRIVAASAGSRRTGTVSGALVASQVQASPKRKGGIFSPSAAARQDTPTTSAESAGAEMAPATDGTHADGKDARPASTGTQSSQQSAAPGSPVVSPRTRRGKPSASSTAPAAASSPSRRRDVDTRPPTPVVVAGPEPAASITAGRQVQRASMQAVAMKPAWTSEGRTSNSRIRVTGAAFGFFDDRTARDGCSTLTFEVGCRCCRCRRCRRWCRHTPVFLLLLPLILSVLSLPLSPPPCPQHVLFDDLIVHALPRLKTLPKLTTLKFCNNAITSLAQLVCLDKRVPSTVTAIHVTHNAVADLPSTRWLLLALLPKLVSVNGQDVADVRLCAPAVPLLCRRAAHVYHPCCRMNASLRCTCSRAPCLPWSTMTPLRNAATASGWASCRSPECHHCRRR